jgi:pimeloyl-ACP methyl ester carboxylesterase
MQTVTSKDGTTIAYDKSGHGPALIVVTGAMGSRTDPHSAAFAQLLSSDLTVINYDRRGRGDSTDTKPSSIQKEIEDIGALIDAVGGTAYLYGISSGGALALEASAALKDKVTKLAVYEVPYDESEDGIKAWHEYTAKLTDAIANNKPGDAVTLFMKFVGVPDEMLAGMRQSPYWQGMEAVAPSLRYDAAALGESRLVPRDRIKNITAQTLVLDGSESLTLMPFMNIAAKEITASLPNAEHKTIEGQSHDVDMKVLAPILKDFYLK